VILLDTNVISELMREAPDASVQAWADALPVADLATSALCAAEIRNGLAQLPKGRRRTSLQERFDGILVDVLRDRVWPFTLDEAALAADIGARRRSVGLHVHLIDMMIAATAMTRGAALATRDGGDFTGTGVSLIDPWAMPEERG
jgi:predicted nucleic acid-binding protein